MWKRESFVVKILYFESIVIKVREHNVKNWGNGWWHDIRRESLTSLLEWN